MIPHLLSKKSVNISLRKEAALGEADQGGFAVHLDSHGQLPTEPIKIQHRAPWFGDFT